MIRGGDLLALQPGTDAEFFPALASLKPVSLFVTPYIS